MKPIEKRQKCLPSSTIFYGAIFISPPGTPLTTWPLVLGLVVTLVAGTLVGVVLAFLFKWTGHDYWLLKSVGLGVVLWPVHVAIIPALMDKGLYAVLPPKMIGASLLLSALWGLIAGFVLELETKGKTLA